MQFYFNTPIFKGSISKPIYAYVSEDVFTGFWLRVLNSINRSLK
jgi:hypothetical protein